MGTRTLPKVLRTTLDTGGPGRAWKMFTMRPRFSLLVALAVLLLVPALAWAGPTLYVCTPTAQVLKVVVSDSTATTTVLVPTPAGTAIAGSLYDCVVGPDGYVYAATDKNILRVSTVDGSYRFLKADSSDPTGHTRGPARPVGSTGTGATSPSGLPQRACQGTACING